ncbi:hypothetical protein ITJ86_09420 [Winogradskyella sp. F6397]|uniref:Uncharacterized protein n=1 Tax=Winogradskyella marina TaxID=2785530 RepID=A0ABS0EI39_9FLAO|nr:hypothetical protein [Winogradskyella marina]MBF8150115.1 hypothetical protein [Winogradskyella marina]
MKKCLTLLMCAVLISFTSCQFSENIYVNEDGSGTVKFSMDASEMMDVLEQLGENAADEMGKAVDSTIVFKDFLVKYKDSISKLSLEEQEKVKAMEDYTLHMVMDPHEKKMFFDIETDFDNANELRDMYKAMNNFNSLKGDETASDNLPLSPFSSMGNEGSTLVSYSYNGKVFKRNVEIIDVEKHQKSLDSIDKSALMLGSSKYVVNYHFPKPIKSFSKEGAMYSEDRKTVTYTVGFIAMLKDPEILNLEVVLED